MNCVTAIVRFSAGRCKFHFFECNMAILIVTDYTSECGVMFNIENLGFHERQSVSEKIGLLRG